jgi:hypothetical protein
MNKKNGSLTPPFASNACVLTTTMFTLAIMAKMALSLIAVVGIPAFAKAFASCCPP